MAPRLVAKMSGSLSIRRELALSSAEGLPCARFAFSFVLAAVMLAGAPLLSAQSSDSQQNSQDVAEAARQARARRQQAAGEKHVYTNEDLRRPKILTPDDQARAAAAKEKQQRLTPATQPEAQPLDANSTPPQESLGDIARHYRNAKKISPFHLPTNHAELASPKITAPIPELKSVLPAQPQPPARDFVIAKPVAPISRHASPNAPAIPSAHPHRVDPFFGRRTQPVAPSNSYLRPVAPTTAAPRARLTNRSRTALSSVANAQVIVQPGDTLWNLSREHLGRGTRWLELMAANPNLPDPSQLVPGTVLSLPVRATLARPKPTANSTTVRAGDTLTKLALETYGHASDWTCIAQANPTLANPDRLAIGQTLTLPASCRP